MLIGRMGGQETNERKAAFVQCLVIHCLFYFSAIFFSLLVPLSVSLSLSLTPKTKQRALVFVLLSGIVRLFSCHSSPALFGFHTTGCWQEANKSYKIHTSSLSRANAAADLTPQEPGVELLGFYFVRFYIQAQVSLFFFKIYFCFCAEVNQGLDKRSC